jgi:hypothetical protein
MNIPNLKEFLDKKKIEIERKVLKENLGVIPKIHKKPLNKIFIMKGLPKKNKKKNNS